MTLTGGQKKSDFSDRDLGYNEQLALDSNNERRFVKVDKRDRATYATGLLGLENDIDGLGLGDR